MDRYDQAVGANPHAASCRATGVHTKDVQIMRILRRFLVVLALTFWQGGSMFYGAVVVGIVRAQLGQPERSLITQRVTQWLNLAGTIALLLLFTDVWASILPVKRWRWLTWSGMALPHVAMVWLHHELSRQMAVPGFVRSDQRAFLSWHALYLSCNVVQWLAAMAFVVVSLRAWRLEDVQG